MFGLLRNSFSARGFEDDVEKTLPESVFNVVSFAILAALVLMSLGTLFIVVKKATVGMLLLLSLAVLLASRILAKRGYVSAASIVVVSAMWLVSTISILLAGGLNTATTGSYVMLTVTSAMLLGRRAGVLVAGVSAVTGLGIALIPSFGYALSRHLPLPPLSAWFALICWLLLTVPTVWLALQALNDAVSKARQEAKERKSAEQALRTSHDELDQRVKERTRQLVEANTKLTKEIEQRKSAEGQLIETEQRYRQIVENATDLIYRTDANGCFTFVNSVALRMLGYSQEEFVGKHYSELIAPEHRKDGERFYGIQFVKKTPETYWEFPAVTKQGGTVWLGQNTQLIMDGDTVVGFQSITRDITDRKKTEQALRESERKYRLLADNVSDIIWTMDLNLKQTYCTPSVLQIRGYTVEEAVSHSLDEILAPSSYELATQTIARELPAFSGTDQEATKTWTLDLEMLCRDGSTVWTEMKVRPLFDEQRNVTGFLGVAREITERRKAQKQLESSLAEKEILMKEIHHRVKNNLQLMSSLLSLQGLRSGERDSKTVLRDAENRVWAMALAHETLYRSRDMSSISAHEYLGKLVEDVMGSTGADATKVTLVKNLEDRSFNIDVAINCGLILNELIVNSVKHAFPGGRKGELRVELRFDGSDTVYLSVADNGVGLPDDINIESAESFGLDLVNMLVAELKGNVELKRDRGSEFIIRFMQNPDAAEP